MATVRIDRRVARTRAALEQAILSLILAKGYDAVTVEEICEAANVGRSTFYSHYRDKDELKRSGFAQYLNSMVDGPHTGFMPASSDAVERLFSFCRAMFEHGRNHMELYKALAGGRGGRLGLETLRSVLRNLARDALTEGNGPKPDAATRDLAVQYVVGAYLAVLTWWLDSGAKLSPEQMEAIFKRMTTEGCLRRTQ